MMSGYVLNLIAIVIILDETDGLQENDNVLYYMAFHKTLKHVIFARAASPRIQIQNSSWYIIYILAKMMDLEDIKFKQKMVKY